MPIRDKVNTRVSLLAITGLLSGLFASTAFALGLGEMTLNSSLNEPLDATIEVLEIDGLDETQMRFEMASQDDFDRVNVERIFLLDQIDFEVVKTSANTATLHLTSDSRIVEPYLNFVVSARWPTGRLMREYTVLLDLPIYSDAAAPSVQPATAAPVVEEIADTQVDEVEQIVPSQVAVRTEPVTEEVVEEIVAEEVITEEVVTEEIAPTLNNNEEGSTVVIETNDTLWEIALNTRPENSVSVQQMMLAIQRTNPEAFIDNNINRIRAGQVLRIPSMRAIMSLDQQQAVNQVALQNQETSTSPQPLAVNSNQSASSSALANDDELRVLTANDVNAGGSTNGGNGDSGNSGIISSLQDQLALSEEGLDRAQIENAELNDLLAEMEAEISLLQNIIEVEDQRLAQLQQSLAEQEELSRQAELAPVVANVAQADIAAPTTPTPAAPTSAPTSTPSVVNTSSAQVVQTGADTGLVAQISGFFQNTLVLIGAVAALIVVALGFLLWRGREQEQEEEELFEDEFAPESEPYLLEDEFEKPYEDEGSFDELDEFENVENLNNSEQAEVDTDDFADVNEEVDAELDDSVYAETESLDVEDVEDVEGAEEAEEAEETGELDELENEDIVGESNDELEDNLDESDISSLEDDFEEEEELPHLSDEEALEELEELVASAEPLTALTEDDDDFDLSIDDEQDGNLEELGRLGALMSKYSDDDSSTDDATIPGDSLEVGTDAKPLAALSAGSDQDYEEDLNDSIDSLVMDADDLEIEFEIDLDEVEVGEVEIEGESKVEDITASTKDNLIEFPLNAEVFKMPDDHARESIDAGATNAEGGSSDDLESFEFTLASSESEDEVTEAIESLTPKAEELETIDFGSDDLAINGDEDFAIHDEFADVEEISEEGASTEETGLEHDQYATKLDLAVAYEAMGDFDGARSILREVVAAGSEAQAGEARRLLEKQ